MSNQNQSQLSLMSLYEVGAQRGNRKSRLNPRLKNRIYAVMQGLCLIDLVKTQDSLQECASLLQKLGQRRKQVLIVGTSKHLSALLPDYAATFDGGPMPYVNARWLGGTITNWSTIKKTLKTLEKMQKIEENKEFFTKLSKNEQLNIKKKKDKILKFFSGLVNLKTSKPGAVIVLDAANNPIAIQEAEAAGIPVIAITNTTCNLLPQDLRYTVVSNVNSLKAVSLILEQLSVAYNAGVSASVPKPDVIEEEKN